MAEDTARVLAPPPLIYGGALAVGFGIVIAREERYLERKFGSEYAAYKQQVRRWL